MVQQLFAGFSQTEGEEVQDIQREMPPEVEDIPSSTTVEDHQSRLHIWTWDHPPGQIIESPFACIRTQPFEDLTKQCHYVAFMQSSKPKTIKDAFMDHDWIVAIQEEIAEF